MENLFSDSLLTKKTHIARIEFLKSWSAASASIVSEYRSAYNYETQSRSDQFGLSSGASLFLGSVLTSKSTLTLTSLSAYADIDHYVYAGEGRGDYVYDENTDSYVYDDVYGSYIKLTERAVSSESGVGKRL
ncbi:MAG: hypothetical protein PHW02_07595, partial [bacterium]|nr:hypothetical protein [bacterium]